MQELMSLRAADIPVALRLAEAPEAKYKDLSADLGMSASTAYESVQRLQGAGLLRPESRTVNWLALREFLAHGLRYAFSVRPGALVRGVPTAYSAPPLSGRILADDAVVWPDSEGQVEGQAIAPLLPRAHELPERCPSLYQLLALADALRFGRVRERVLALEALDVRLGAAARA